MAIKVHINNIQPAFNKAHRILWEKYNPTHRVLSHFEVDAWCKKYWLQEHQVEIINSKKDPDAWEYVVFQNDSHLTYFMLKYS